MAFVNLVGAGPWFPTLPIGYFESSTAATITFGDLVLLDADEEEGQIIGQVTIDGSGTKTFGTSGSKICWLPGATLTFAAGSTLTLGIKTGIDFTAGPPPRATLGAAAFNVFKSLVGGTDTITATTWREDAMASGTPFTITDGDKIAVCWHLDTSSGTPSIKVRGASVSGPLATPSCASTTLVTSGPTYTGQTTYLPNFILIFDDGTIGWLEPTITFSTINCDTASGNIGNGNIFGNIFRLPFTCKIDAITACVTPAGNTSDFALELYSSPLGTPVLVESIPVDANNIGSGQKLGVRRLATHQTILANTDYLVGVRQTTANAITVMQKDNANGNYAKTLGMGQECYAATSTAGATFADSLATQRRRYSIHFRISAIDVPVAAGGMLSSHPGMLGGLSA